MKSGRYGHPDQLTQLRVLRKSLRSAWGVHDHREAASSNPPTPIIIITVGRSVVGRLGGVWPGRVGKPTTEWHFRFHSIRFAARAPKEVLGVAGRDIFHSC